MKERKSKTLLLATSKQIREAAWQDGHQRTKCFETSNVMLLLLLWHGDFSLENFFQDCFPSFLSYFVYVSLTPRQPPSSYHNLLVVVGARKCPIPTLFSPPTHCGEPTDVFSPCSIPHAVTSCQMTAVQSPVWNVLSSTTLLNPLVLELDIYSLAHHLCKMWIFYEPRRITLGNTRHFLEK